MFQLRLAVLPAPPQAASADCAADVVLPVIVQCLLHGVIQSAAFARAQQSCVHGLHEFVWGVDVHAVAQQRREGDEDVDVRLGTFRVSTAAAMISSTIASVPVLPRRGQRLLVRFRAMFRQFVHELRYQVAQFVAEFVAGTAVAEPSPPYVGESVQRIKIGYLLQLVEPPLRILQAGVPIPANPFEQRTSDAAPFAKSRGRQIGGMLVRHPSVRLRTAHQDHQMVDVLPIRHRPLGHAKPVRNGQQLRPALGAIHHAGGASARGGGLELSLIRFRHRHAVRP